MLRRVSFYTVVVVLGMSLYGCFMFNQGVESQKSKLTAETQVFETTSNGQTAIMVNIPYTIDQNGWLPVMKDPYIAYEIPGGIEQFNIHSGNRTEHSCLPPIKKEYKPDGLHVICQVGTESESFQIFPPP